MKEQTKKVLHIGGAAVSSTVLGAVSYRLYLRQAIHYPGQLGTYDSDLPAHIQEGRAGTSYSLIERSFGFLMDTLGCNEKAVALWLALLTVATIWITLLVMKQLFPNGNPAVLYVLALASMFVMPIYLPQLNQYRYLGLQSGTIWHNSTYIGMRFAAMCLLLLYFWLQEHYRQRFLVGQFMLFTFLLIFVNLMKPNFILCFAPAMAVMLLTDCIADRGRTLKRQIFFGIPVLISLAVVAYETIVLFGDGNDGASILIDFGYAWKLNAKHPVIALLQSGALPLLVLCANRKALKTDRRYRMTWLIWLAALLEYLLLSESGTRRAHGNFSWGYCFALFLVFAVSLVWLYRNLKDWRQLHGAKGLSWKKAGQSDRLKMLYLFLALLLLGLHLYFGAESAWIIFHGGSYY